MNKQQSISEIFLPNAQATHQAGHDFAHQVKPGDVIYLRGELGAGKTTFTQGFLQGLGYEGPVTSPTYTLVEPYVLPHAQIFHFDLYRLKDPRELEFIGMEEYFTPQSICLIEWPERGVPLLPKPQWEIILSYADEGRMLVKKCY